MNEDLQPLGHWSPWRAWFPIVTIDGRLLWFVRVDRRRARGWYADLRTWFYRWQYKAQDPRPPK